MKEPSDNDTKCQQASREEPRGKQYTAIIIMMQQKASKTRGLTTSEGEPKREEKCTFEKTKSECGEGERVGLDRRGRTLPLGEAVAEFTICDDGVQSPCALLLCLLLHLNLETCLGTGNRRTVTVEDR